MFDLIIDGGMVYGAEPEPVRADVAVSGDRVAAIGALADAEAAARIDATGKAVAPGFINILSHSYFTMIHDPRSLGELTQGVTTQVFGEGGTMGPLTPARQREIEDQNTDLSLEVSWSRLSEYLSFMEHRGCSQNIASFIGNGTLRPFVLGYADRRATTSELDAMRAIVAEEMADGALGLASALIYPPETYCSTEELVALCKEVAAYGGIYASHIRSEDAHLAEAIDELVGISAEAGLPAEVFHLKASRRPYWKSMPGVLARLEQVRSQGARVTADVYPYTASSTGLTSVIPAEFHEGGAEALYDRLADPTTRETIRSAIVDTARWPDEQGADEVLILGVRREHNVQYQGLTLQQVAEMRGTDPVEAALELIADDRSRVTVAFFTMSEDNLREQLTRPWVGVASDGSSMAPEGVSLHAPTHPRSYGTFARLLGTYVRDEGLLTLNEAVDKVTRKPADTLGLADRGRLVVDAFADVVVFDPDRVCDRATFTDPHQLSVGVSDVIVNGTAAIRGGEFTGQLPGRAVYGPGRQR
ncbi:MAG: N-acyl-D-amino-acid deacylase family protein [Nocardioidaceae bacterium]